MKVRSIFNEKGVTLVELLIALVISALVLAGIYRVFIGQTRTYTVQEQVVDVQQSVRSAMDILVRDLRMAGYDHDNLATVPSMSQAFGLPLQNNSIQVNYEYYNASLATYQNVTAAYSLSGSQLMRTSTVDGTPTTEVLLQNVSELIFTYGIDGFKDSDGVMDDYNGDGAVNDSDWVTFDMVGAYRVVAIRVRLTAMPNSTNTDVTTMVSPRTFLCAVTPRNLCLR